MNLVGAGFRIVGCIGNGDVDDITLKNVWLNKMMTRKVRCRAW